MKRFSKISIDDIKTIQVDSGVLLKEFDVENPIFLPENVICATSGGINPVCAPEYYDFGEDVDNAKPSKETKRIRGWNVTISFTTLTTSLSMIKLALGAADISGKVLSLRQRLQYAKDFKDIWWVGKRADDKLIAIRLIRSLSDSGFSLQTTKKGKGQISVTLKGHSSFAEKDKIPMEVYIFAESDIPIVPDEPDTPTTAMYIYGTPSNGVKYNGVELPDIEAVWTDKETYPYAFIQTAGTDSACVRFSTVQPYTDGIYIRSTNASYMEYDLSSDKTEWVFYKSRTEYTGSHFDVANFLWSNCDIADSSGTVQFAATEPVHSGNIGLRSGESVTYYDGVVIPPPPELPQGYEEYTYMGLSPALFNTYPVAALYFHNSAYYFKSTGGYFFGGNDDTPVPSLIATYEKDSGAWSELTVHDNYNVNVKKGMKGFGVFWTNFDLLNEDGTVCVEKTDPIPVSGIVDYVGDIPVYEVIT